MTDATEPNIPKVPQTQPHPDEDDESSPHNFDQTIKHIPRVLIIEDALELADLLKMTLEQMQILVFHESQGLKALDRYKVVRPDLVLLDIGLPDMTGWKVLDAIKELKSIYKRPAIVVMTAYGDPANRLMGKLQGVEQYLVKPFTGEELRRVISQVLDMKLDEKR